MMNGVAPLAIARWLHGSLKRMLHGMHPALGPFNLSRKNATANAIITQMSTTEMCGDLTCLHAEMHQTNVWKRVYYADLLTHYAKTRRI